MRKTLKAYAIALGITGVLAVTVFIGTSTDNKPDPVLGISFPYTDDLTDECLHIYSDDQTYDQGLSQADVYLAVVNQCGKAQDVELIAYFNDDKKRIEDVAVLTTVTRERTVPEITETCTEVTGTTTETICRGEQTGERTEQFDELVWLPLPVVERTSGEKTKEETSLKGLTRKADSGFVSGRKSTGFEIEYGEVLYYKVVIRYTPNQSGAFFFEAIGSDGGYGHLQ